MSRKASRLNRYSALLVILGSALWGTDAVFRRPLTASLSPVTIVFLEHCVLALVTIPVVLKLRGQFLQLRKRDYAPLLVIAIGGSVVATVLFTFAMKYGNPTAVILLQKTQPLFTVILACVVLGERPARWFWPWFAGAMAGATLISLPDLHSGFPAMPELPAASLCAIGASILWGSATVCGRYIVSKISTPFLTSLRFILALPVLAILYSMQAPQARRVPTDLYSALTVIEMALIPGLLALLLYYKGLRATTAWLASVCELSFPVTAIVVNWLVLHTKLSAVQFVGSALLVSSVTIVVILNSRARQSWPDADPHHIV
jgi:drug/metabolite transporter (DMT)-like permease